MLYTLHSSCTWVNIYFLGFGTILSMVLLKIFSMSYHYFKSTFINSVFRSALLIDFVNFLLKMCRWFTDLVPHPLVLIIIFYPNNQYIGKAVQIYIIFFHILYPDCSISVFLFNQSFPLPSIFPHILSSSISFNQRTVLPRVLTKHAKTTYYKTRNKPSY